MRLWSIHPQYLDTKGLVAVWREGLLALHVLRGETTGYTRHPQLIRFQAHPEPVTAIATYLHAIVDEAEARAFLFQRDKLPARVELTPIEVTSGQMEYEVAHLKSKLAVRDMDRWQRMEAAATVDPHPLFTVVPGERATWEKAVPSPE